MTLIKLALENRRGIHNFRKAAPAIRRDALRVVKKSLCLDGGGL
jgi:hypothetical protein